MSGRPKRICKTNMHEKMVQFSIVSNFIKMLTVRTIYSFMINIDDIVFFIYSLISCFVCMNDIQQYYTERTRGLCKLRLKIPGRFLIEFLFLWLNLATVILFRCFSFSLTFCTIIYFQYPRNEYIHVLKLSHWLCLLHFHG